MRVLFLLLLLFPTLSHAVIETYEFNDDTQRVRYQQFIEELRCPKCQNQNLSGSNSPIAEDLRRELYQLLQDGRSDQEIVDFMVSRYGEFILYRPRLQLKTALLWLSPLLFLLIGAVVLIRIMRAEKQVFSSSEEQVKTEDHLSVSEQQQLKALLAEQDKNEEER
jgi:cytochrome c-type biogenesis protein CcmH